jgi:hypothetical protein
MAKLPEAGITELVERVRAQGTHGFASRHAYALSHDEAGWHLLHYGNPVADADGGGETPHWYQGSGRSEHAAANSLFMALGHGPIVDQLEAAQLAQQRRLRAEQRYNDRVQDLLGKLAESPAPDAGPGEAIVFAGGASGVFTHCRHQHGARSCGRVLTDPAARRSGLGPECSSGRCGFGPGA